MPTTSQPTTNSPTSHPTAPTFAPFSWCITNQNYNDAINVRSLTSTIVPSSVVDVSATITWKDQGFGYQKGQIRMHQYRNGQLLKTVRLFGKPAPHTLTTDHTSAENCNLKDVFANDELRFDAVVGTGGSHSLQINSLCITIIFGPNICPTWSPTHEPTSNQTIEKRFILTLYGNKYALNETLLDIGYTWDQVIIDLMSVNWMECQILYGCVVIVESVSSGSVIIEYKLTGDNATFIDFMVINIVNELTYNSTIYNVISNIEYTQNPTQQPTLYPTNVPTTPRPTIDNNSLWKQQSSRLPFPDSNMAIGCYNSFIYMLGGTTHQQIVIKYNIALDNFWYDENSLNRKTYGNGQFYAHSNSKIFMIDYYGSYLNMFSMKTETFNENLYTIPKRVNSFGCLAASDSNYIFVIGGVDNSYAPLNHAQILDLNNNEWLDVSYMLEVRRSLSCVYDNNSKKVFAISGIGNGISTTVEYLYTNGMEHNSWQMIIEQLPEGVFNSQAVVVHGWIWLIGGTGSISGKLDTIYVIDPLTETISTFPQKLLYGVSSTSSIVFSSHIMVFGGIIDPFQAINTWMKYSSPTIDPTTAPTSQPTLEPTLEPIVDPTTEPTYVPTIYPTYVPTIHPSLNPSTEPTLEPTLHPTIDPTYEPSIYPSTNPTNDPSSHPTLQPTSEPTTNPTMLPTTIPSMNPTTNPTENPTTYPTIYPSSFPSNNPTIEPTNNPTIYPTTIEPTIYPTIEPTI
eukprot:382118_1